MCDASAIFAAVRRTVSRYKSDHDTDFLHDIAQEVFVRLVKSDYRLLRSYDPDRSSITTWLTMVARSTTIDQLHPPSSTTPVSMS